MSRIYFYPDIIDSLFYPGNIPDMSPQSCQTCTAFAGHRLIATGRVADVAGKVKKHADRQPDDPILVFDDATAEQVELDLRGAPAHVSARLQSPASPPADPETLRGRGRPKLGVVAREVTLLPRHWQWLSAQPSGASVALRKLVEEARKTHAVKDRVRRAQEVAYRFMSAIAGNLPDFEEATRALFATDSDRFRRLTQRWPHDVRDHARNLAKEAF
jgi:hypothetical protein